MPDNHEYFMQRCFDLAALGAGGVSPNPLVGCVIVNNGQIIGEGYHSKAGGPHAEVEAERNIENKSLLKDATLYVNLEPCCFHGRTPACTDLILKSGIPRVVFSIQDPHPNVSGSGASILRDAGVNVVEGVMERQGQFLNRRFVTFQTKRRPYVILKWAMSTDGFMDISREAGQTGQHHITQPKTQILTHTWRAQEDAILIGRSTALNDEPSLTVRAVEGNNPTKVLIDPQLSVSPSNKLFEGRTEVIVFNEIKEGTEEQISYVKNNAGTDFVPTILNALFERNIISVIVEGGKKTLEHFIGSGQWDEARILKGDQSIGNGLTAPTVEGLEISSYHYGLDHVSVILNQ
jgi:diaminohydroxyphosphoribosylaminopyrimidine deaminase/5-amino-6-(5-phosphoribosylamino)uracil reductase